MQITYAQYYDKVLAGWLGKSIGGVVGAPLENVKQYNSLALDTIWPETMAANDDLDIQVVWLEAMQERGVFLTSDDLAEFWQDRCWYWFCEYGVFLNNLQRGIAPPLSGTWNNGYFRESEGCPIRSEIWGFVAPGNPRLAAELATKDGQLDHGGVSVQTEAFLAAAAAQAMVTDSLQEALEAGCSVIPTDSPVVQAIPVVQDICARFPDPKQAWRQVIRRFGDRNANKALTNHAIVLMALFLGQQDFQQTMLLCVNSGWDTDCTAATSGALLGALHGTAGLPADWVKQLGPSLICGINVKHRNALLTDFAEDTCRIGVEMAAVRNPYITFTGAPQVAVRPAPAPAVTLEVAYPEEPVLRDAAATPVTITVHNPTADAVNGTLAVTPAPGTTCTIPATAITVDAGKSREVTVTITRTQSGSWLADKNLFTATFSAGETAIAQRQFGLGGARQWQVYGPYWDLCDTVRNPICPFANDAGVRPPFTVGMTGDCYNSYARLDKPYLDEAQLLRGDLPDEVPLLLEKGEDLLTEQDLGGYCGQGCYYLVRTIQATDGPRESSIYIGRSGPFRLWLDGKEIAAADDMRGWCTYEEPGVKVTLTGKPQRLVLKVIRLTDAFNVSMHFMCKGDPEYKRGVSNILDSLADLPSATVVTTAPALS